MHSIDRAATASNSLIEQPGLTLVIAEDAFAIVIPCWLYLDLGFLDVRRTAFQICNFSVLVFLGFTLNF